ncbi:MAG: aldehyde dehydrogenase family protein [Gammaproteobacteria bacterium]|nr:MAG: aldehyde dehydrogenase family protein [Gammaproteobacteria bacterium]
MDVLEELGIKPMNPGVYSGAGWSRARDAEVLHSPNPASEELIASVSLCTEQDYEIVMAQAHEAFLEWRTVPAPRRGEVVRCIAEELRTHKDALGSLISLEVGKIKVEGDGEVQEMIDIADFAVGQSRMLYGNTMQSERPQHRMYEQWHPLGVVGVITAFNFPVAVYSWNAFIAAVAGNVTVWKPSPKAPLCALAVQNICNRVTQAMGCAGVFSLMVATAPSAVADRFINDTRVPLISFTGSTAAGREVAKTVAARLGKTILEMGGNNAIVVDETANMDLAVPAIVFGAVGTAGQRCTTTRRIIVHESRYEELIGRLVPAYEQVPVGDPLNGKTLMGPLIDQRAVEGYEAVIAETRALGAEVLCGGKVRPGPGHFVEPTAVHVQDQWDVVQRETFAPILYVMTYKTLEEAIAIHNGVPQGLSSAIFTRDLQRSERFLSVVGSDCGIANVNIGTSGAEIGGAFGGEKDTGGGREAGSDAWKAYMRRQTTTINWGDELPLAQGIDFSVGSTRSDR